MIVDREQTGTADYTVHALPPLARGNSIELARLPYPTQHPSRRVDEEALSDTPSPALMVLEDGSRCRDVSRCRRGTLHPPRCSRLLSRARGDNRSGEQQPTVEVTHPAVRHAPRACEDAVKRFVVESWGHATSRVCTDPSPHERSRCRCKAAPGLLAGKPNCAAINRRWT